MEYPEAERLDLVETIHGQPIPDPYRWLEDTTLAATIEWSAAQDSLCRAVLDGLPGREHLRARLRELLASGLVSAPVVRGDRLFFLRRTAEQEHPVLFLRDAGGERALVDPAVLSPDATTTLDGYAVSHEGDLLAYWLSEGGDEEAVLRVLAVETGEIVDGPIGRTRYCPLAWLPGGKEFFYGRRLDAADVPAGDEMFHRRVWRHRVGAPIDDDVLVFGDGRDKTEYHALEISRDGRWLAISGSLGTAPRNDVYLADLEAGTALRVIQEGDDVETEIDMGHDGLLYMLTNRDAPRRRIVVADPTAPQPGDWRELVAESDAVLLGFVLTDDAIVVSSTRQAVAAVDVYDRATGAHRAAVPLPGLGAIVGLTASPDGGDDVYIGYTDFVTPPEVHHYSVAAGAIEVWEHAPGARAGSPAVLARQVEYPSKDGTAVPMFVIARDDITPGTPRPTVLNGYGGFNIAMTPGYSAALLTWVECGGIYAVACLRGGSERGETWHRAGMREHKQNVFDDFAAAADWLVGEGWTSPQRLAISGGSNGGLLVGAALTQWPEKYAAVMCSAPLLDMIRYERYGLGVTWNDEYGTADDPVEFGWLLGYSPYHRVVEGTAYPAVLFTVFESDTRVDPFHARKMAAALQHATSSDQPILLRRERDVGHAARSISRTVDLAVDTMSFLADRCGLDVEPG